MDSVFIKVDPKDRLPEKEGIIPFVHVDGGVFTTYYSKGIDIGSSVEYWLEEVKIPTDEEIKMVRDSYSYSKLSETFRWGWKYSTNYFLRLLKGEENGK